MPLFPLRRRRAPAPRNRRAPAAMAPAPFHPTALQSRFNAWRGPQRGCAARPACAPAGPGAPVRPGPASASLGAAPLRLPGAGRPAEFRSLSAPALLAEQTARSPRFALLADGVPAAEACATLPVNRVTFYRWRQDPAFRYWLASNQLRDLVLDGGALLTMARAKAAENFPYWNALARLTFDPTTRRHLCDWAEWCGAGSAAPSLAAAPAASDPEAENVAFKAVTD